MFLIEQASFVIAKGGCYLCLKGGPLVDTEVSIEGEGALAICAGCTHDIAKLHGLNPRKPKA